MARRMLLMLLVTAAVIAALGWIKFRQIQEAIAQSAEFQPPPEAITTIIAQQEEWPDTLRAIGTIVAVQGVMVSADLPGIVDRILFQSGDTVRQGDVLVQLDTRQEQAQLAAAEANRDFARASFARLQGLVDEGAISRDEYDEAAAERKQTEAAVQEVRATIERKTIRAPFSGVLGIREVNLGQYLSPGDPVVPLQSLNPIYVNFDVPQSDARRVPVGRSLRVFAGNEDPLEFRGRITAINSIVDPATRNLQVQATLANPRAQLKPGMFVETEVTLGTATTVVPLPATAISYAPYGDSVFIVTDLQGEDGTTYRGVRQQFVELGPSRGDQVAVLSGVNPGDEVATSGIFKLRNGAAVFVNNEVLPSNEQVPELEDN